MTQNIVSVNVLYVLEKNVYPDIIILLDIRVSIFKVIFFFCSGVLFVTKGTFGQLTCEWQYSFDEFTKEPFIVHGRRLRIEAKVR